MYKRLRGCILILAALLILYMFATYGNKPQNEVLPAPTQAPAAQLTPISPTIYYAVDAIDLRSCPRSDCSVVEHIEKGLPLAVSGTIRGQEVESGNPIWYKVEHSAASDEYAYSHFLSATPVVK